MKPYEVAVWSCRMKLSYQVGVSSCHVKLPHQVGAFSCRIKFKAALGTAVTVTDTFIATGDLHVSSATGSMTIAGTPVVEDLIYFQVYRDADNGSDTYTQDARLLGIAIQYKENTTAPSQW